MFGQVWLPHTDKVLGWRQSSLICPMPEIAGFLLHKLGKSLYGQLLRSMQQFNEWINRLNFYTLKTSVGGIQLRLAMRGPCVLAFPRGLANHASQVERRRDTSGQ